MRVLICCALHASVASFPVKAQVDSSLIITLSIGTVAKGCNILITGWNSVSGDTTLTTEDATLSVDDTFSGSFADYLTRSSSISSFQIDTVSRRLMNLSVSKLKDVYYGSIDGGFNQLRLFFDTLSYQIDSTGAIDVNRKVLGKYYFAGYRSYDNHSEHSRGGCYDSGYVMDTISIRMVHPLLLVRGINSNTASDFRINYSRGHLIVFLPKDRHEIQIFDCFGRKVFRFNGAYKIPIEERVDLPPGSYFARLGTEVAKFIVME
jgi:hypothetical protein